MQLTNAELGDVLLSQKHISDSELKESMLAATQRHVDLRTVLFEKHLVTSDLLENAVAAHYNLPLYDLINNKPTKEVVTMLPQEFARAHSVIVVAADNEGVTVATCDPTEAKLTEEIAANIKAGEQEAVLEDPMPAKKGSWLTGKAKEAPAPVKAVKRSGPFKGKVRLVYAPKTDIQSSFTLYHKTLATRLLNLSPSQLDAPKILDEIINEAQKIKASDIHMEPQEDKVTVRFRVDGVLYEAAKLTRAFYEEIINRIKIQANLRIDEHYTTQDGAIRHKTETGLAIDVRVSIVPIVDGEKVVMRLLSEYVRNVTLNDLGFSDAHRRLLESAANKPFGMIINTGPTGSGKSTTLYGLIKMRNQPNVNISTIEDPVEYKVPGINHIQVNQGTGLTFAKGLRALMRQDPDIILVGEVRDSETANIAVNAALTGHLVFSTLHSNDSATAIPRLIDMGVEPFLVASTIEIIIAQRLARRICTQCRFSYDVPAAEARTLFRGADHYFTGEQPVRFYRGKGCEACSNKGYTGRVGIFELLVVDKTIEELIIGRATSSEILLQARLNGMQMMFEDGLEKVKIGMTTIEEVLRIAAPPEDVARK